MVDVQLSDAEKTFIIHGVQDNLREDGRGCEDYRHMEIETDVVSNTSGSAKIRLANTEILVGVKAELGEPTAGKPDKGRLEFFVDCSANATPEWEGRGGEELATEISNVLSRAYDCPSCLDLGKLCVIPGKQCWVLYIDVLLLECGGNLFDAASIAVKAALFNTSIPTLTVSQDEGHVELELSDDPFDVQRLDVTSAPCVVTLSKIGHSHTVDASQKEESCCLARIVAGILIYGTPLANRVDPDETAPTGAVSSGSTLFANTSNHVTMRLMLGVAQKGTITAMKKEGSGSLAASSVDEMLETGKRVGAVLNKSLMEVLLSDDKPTRKKQLTGFLR